MKTARNTAVKWSFVAALLLSVACGKLMAAPATEAPAIIPTPKSLKLAGGSLAIGPGNRVVYTTPDLEPLAKLLAADIKRVHGLALGVAKDEPKPGDIQLQLVKTEAVAGHCDSYVVSVADHVTVQGGRYNDIAMGMMTVLQAAKGDAKGVMIAKMAVMDYGDRAFRALQVSIRGGYHSPQWVKQVIDVMRFYKVRVLQLHTTEILWAGSTMESSNGADPKLLQQNSAWSKKEMEDVIAYATERGVSMLPHNEMRPNDPFWPPTLTVDFNPSDKFAGYVDEVDGKGKYEIKGDLAKDERFWNFVKVATQRSYDQFAKSWPGGKLPYYHIGPVYGEGGCNGKEAVKMLGFLMEKNPDIKMMYWNGPGNNDPDLTPHKKNIVVDFYSATWGGTPDGLLEAGYELCNVSWTPLYILPGSRVKAMKQGKWIFDEFQLSRFCGEAHFGETPIKNARDCSKWQKSVIGSILPTWDFSGPNDREGHMDMITPCIPYYAEHAWNVRPWPYPKGAWEKASAAVAKVSPLVDSIVRQERPSSAPGGVTATQGALPAAVDVFWSESDNYPSSYQVYRADVADSAKAVAISGKIASSFIMGLNKFRDDKVKPGQKYFYWVRSINPYGGSAFGQPVQGFTGDGVAVPVTYEGFDYKPGAALDTLNGGTGFKDAWSVKQMNAPITVNSYGLTYPGLLTTGKSARFEILHDESEGRNPTHTAVVRHLATVYGKPGTEVWTSFLIRPIKNTYSTSISYNRISTGKLYGSYSIAGVPAEDGKTYLVVTRSNFQNGPDLLTMWVNPAPGRMPLDSEATIVSRQEDNNESDILSINVEAYYRGGSDIDELRTGATYQSIVPVAK